MKVESTRIRVRGVDTDVPSTEIQGCKLIVTGRWLKTVSIFDEELLEEIARPDPLDLIARVKAAGLRADTLTFGRAFMDAELPLVCRRELDNLAVAQFGSFQTWWKALPQESRKNVRVAAKRGVVVRPVELDASLAAGIKRIYDETPVRQGRRFWHYRKELDDVWSENQTYLARSQFIGAYFENELIGFIKYVRVDRAAVLIQILAMNSHRDKKPINALLASAVELCESQQLTQLVYGKFNYGAAHESTLTEFKRRNGFIQRDFFRYFVPLSIPGRMAISVGGHRDFRYVAPAPLLVALRRARAWVVRASETSQRGRR